MITTTRSESELLEGRIVAVTSFQRHFDGYIRYALDKMNLEILYSEGELSERFYDRFDGTLLFFHAKDINNFTSESRRYRTILLDHRCQPFGDRAVSPYNADYIICNGSDALIKDIKSTSSFGEHILNIGFFTTHFANQERQKNKAFVQTVNYGYQCPFSHFCICELLFNQDYDVYSFEHVLHSAGHALPEGVRKVEPGLDYIQTLTSCSHYIGYGSSSVIVNAFVPGAVQINLSTDWVSRGSSVFQNVVNGLCYTAHSKEELLHLLAMPPKDCLQEYLYGNDRTDILGKIEAAIAEIAYVPKRPVISYR